MGCEFKVGDRVTLKRTDMPEYKGTVTQIIKHPENRNYLVNVYVDNERYRQQLNGGHYQFTDTHLKKID